MKKPINKISREDVTEYDLGEANGLREYQRIATQSAFYPGKNSPLGLIYVALKLNGEAGELAEHVGKALRDDGMTGVANYHSKHCLTSERRDLLIKEVGDVLWYLAAACEELGISLAEASVINLLKLADRGERGVLSGSGDER